MVTNPPPPEDVKVLVHASRNGEAGAFQKLIELYQPTVRKHVVRLLRQYSCSHLIPEHLDEIVQQIWAELIGQLHKFPEDQFSAWFSFFRRWKTLDYIRKELKFQKRHLLNKDNPGLDNQSASSNQDDPEEALMNRQVRLHVRMCLDKFSPQYQSFINLYYFQGWSYEQIAKHLGIQVGSVGSLHTRAIRKLRKYMKKNKEPFF